MTAREVVMVLIIGFLVMGKRVIVQRRKVKRNNEMREQCAAARQQARIGR